MRNSDELLDLALELYDGETRSGQVCPFCKGGASGDRSLWIGRDGRYVKYKCYRAKCGIGGQVNVRNQTAGERKDELGGKRRVLETTPLPLEPDDIEWLKARYFLNDAEIARSELGKTRLHCHTVSSRLYMPIFRRDGFARGYTARGNTGLEIRKALSFKWREDEPNLSWHNNRQSDKLIIVEDQMSAIRSSTYMNAVALLGVTLNKDKVDEIVRAGFREAYIALDKDATRFAIKSSIAWRTHLTLRIVKLEEDLKDLTREELESFMKELNGA